MDMHENPPGPPPVSPQPVAGVSEETRALFRPLADSAGWLKFLGVMSIIGGCLTALTCYGIIFAWLPIWLGVLQFQAGERLRNGFELGDAGTLYQGGDKLRLSLKIQGVTMICIIALYVVGFALAIMFGVFGALAAAGSGGP